MRVAIFHRHTDNVTRLRDHQYTFPSRGHDEPFQQRGSEEPASEHKPSGGHDRILDQTPLRPRLGWTGEEEECKSSGGPSPSLFNEDDIEPVGFAREVVRLVQSVREMS